MECHTTSFAVATACSASRKMRRVSLHSITRLPDHSPHRLGRIHHRRNRPDRIPRVHQTSRPLIHRLDAPEWTQLLDQRVHRFLPKPGDFLPCLLAQKTSRAYLAAVAPFDRSLEPLPVGCWEPLRTAEVPAGQTACAAHTASARSAVDRPGVASQAGHSAQTAACVQGPGFDQCHCSFPYCRLVRTAGTFVDYLDQTATLFVSLYLLPQQEAE